MKQENDIVYIVNVSRDMCDVIRKHKRTKRIFGMERLERTLMKTVCEIMENEGYKWTELESMSNKVTLIEFERNE